MDTIIVVKLLQHNTFKQKCIGTKHIFVTSKNRCNMLKVESLHKKIYPSVHIDMHIFD